MLDPRIEIDAMPAPPVHSVRRRFMGFFERKGEGHGRVHCRPIADWNEKAVSASAFWDAQQGKGDWQVTAEWIDRNLPYSTAWFFPTYWAFNIGWHERPQRRIDSYAEPKGRWVQRSSPN